MLLVTVALMVALSGTALANPGAAHGSGSGGGGPGFGFGGGGGCFTFFGGERECGGSGGGGSTR
jgi:hypothetical protein